MAWHPPMCTTAHRTSAIRNRKKRVSLVLSAVSRSTAFPVCCTRKKGRAAARPFREPGLFWPVLLCILPGGRLGLCRGQEAIILADAQGRGVSKLPDIAVRIHDETGVSGFSVPVLPDGFLLHRRARGDSPLKDRVHLGRDPKKDRRDLFQKVGVQFQEGDYQPEIKVSELCEETACLYKSPADWKSLCEQFGIGDKVNQAVKSLSGGERQRLFIVLTLIPDPQLVFLDELTTGLDAKARRDVWKILEGA